MANILIVDDVYTTRLQTELVLRNAANHTVQSVNNGAEAVQRALIVAPDVIVLDIVMAGMDGFETLHALHAQGVTCPIIAYTATEEREPGAYQASGFDAYAPKSAGLNQFLHTIRDILQTHHRATAPYTHRAVQRERYLERST